MKKGLVVLLIVMLGFTSISNAEEIPIDSAIRYGKLENGMTYYIRHNEEPKDRVSFFIAQNVGAILESDKQNGLAHFLEHMAFNGTKHFKGKGIFKFLERHGVKFGANINAYTMQNETVYRISNVPTTTQTGLVDSCLLVLNDWSNYLLLTNEEIEAERGVIVEEWRTRRDSRFRIRSKQNQAIFYGSKYAERDVIGDLEVIKNFEPATLREFYHQWYRTDLQAIIVVGDIDVDLVENSIKTLFSKIPAVTNPIEKEVFDIPDNDEPHYVLATDKEATRYFTSLMFKSDAVAPENKDKEYLEQSYIRSLFNRLIKTRFTDRLQQENCPYTNASASIRSLVPTKDLSSINASYKEGEWKASLTEVVRMIENVKKYGFTQGEFDRAKKSVLARMENVYKKRDKTTHDTYAKRYKSHFINNSPIPGIEYKYKMFNDLFSRISLADLKPMTQHFFSEQNSIIIVSGPEKEDVYYPSSDEIIDLVNKTRSMEQKPFVDKFVDKALIINEPIPGFIVNRKSILDKDLKATELELSNGIRVVYRHSELDKEVVRFSARSWGGNSLVGENDIANSYVFNSFISSYGLGEFSAIELKKKLGDKIVSSEISMGSLGEYLNGSASPKDLETLFQLVYLQFANPRFDKKAYNALSQRYNSYLENLSNNVKQAFSDSVSVTLANHHPRKQLFTKELFKEVSFEGIKEIYNQRFANPADFVFVFSGNFDQELLETYLKIYIASLPTTEIKENYVDNGIRSPKSDVNNIFYRELEVDKSTVYVNLHKKSSYSQQNNLYAYVISQILRKRYLKEIREKEGGTYGVSVRSNISQRPNNEFKLVFKFDCDPDKVEKLKGIALDEIQQLMNGNILKSELEEVKQNMLKVRKEGVVKLMYWHRKLNNYAINAKTDMSDYEYIRFIHSIDSKIIAKKAKKFLKNSIKVEVIMSPK